LACPEQAPPHASKSVTHLIRSSVSLASFCTISPLLLLPESALSRTAGCCRRRHRGSVDRQHWPPITSLLSMVTSSDWLGQEPYSHCNSNQGLHGLSSTTFRNGRPLQVVHRLVRLGTRTQLPRASVSKLRSHVRVGRSDDKLSHYGRSDLSLPRQSSEVDSALLALDGLHGRHQQEIGRTSRHRCFRHLSMGQGMEAKAGVRTKN